MFPTNGYRPGILITLLLSFLIFSLIFDGYSISTPAFAISASNLLIGVSLLATALLAVRQRASLLPPPAFRPYLALIGWIAFAELLSAMLAPDRRISDLRSAVTWLGAASIIWLIGLQSRVDVRVASWLMAALAASMATLFVLTMGVLLGVVPLPETGNFGSVRIICGALLPGRALGTPLTFGYFGLLSSLMLPILVMTAAGYRFVPVGRLAAIALTLGILIMVVFTASRSVWVTTVAIALVFPVLAIRQRALGIWVAAVFALGLVVADYLVTCSLAPTVPSLVSPTRPSTAVDSVPPQPTTAVASVPPRSDPSAAIPPENIVSMNTDTVTIRLDSYRIAANMFLSRPLFGQGTASMERAVAAATGIEGPVHNKFIAALGGTGFFGEIPLVLLWITAMVRASRFRHSPDRGVRALGVAYVVAVVGMLVQLQFFGGESLKPAAVLLGLIGIAELTLAGRQTSASAPVTGSN